MWSGDPEVLIRSLIEGGEVTCHTHPNLITLDQLHRMQQLETVVYADADYTCRPQDDFIFVDATVAPVTITLHPAHYGQHITISRVLGGNTVTVAAAAGETVNLASSVNIIASFMPLRLKALSKNTVISAQRSMTPIYGYLEI